MRALACSWWTVGGQGWRGEGGGRGEGPLPGLRAAGICQRCPLTTLVRLHRV